MPKTTVIENPLTDAQQRIADARHHDPFTVLGCHRDGKQASLCAYAPKTETLEILPGNMPMERIPHSDFFIWSGDSDKVPLHYQLRRTDSGGYQSSQYDPYCFAPQLSEYDLHLFGEGRHWHIYRVLGAHQHSVDGIQGILFATWAPNAERVSIVGDFNDWDGRRHPMRNRGHSGVWELFIPGLDTGILYKFEIRNRASGAVVTKTDPYGRQFELRPKTASMAIAEECYEWGDQQWLQRRQTSNWLHAPVSIYEVHTGRAQ